MNKLSLLVKQAKIIKKIVKIGLNFLKYNNIKLNVSELGSKIKYTKTKIKVKITISLKILFTNL